MYLQRGDTLRQHYT